MTEPTTRDEIARYLWDQGLMAADPDADDPDYAVFLKMADWIIEREDRLTRERDDNDKGWADAEKRCAIAEAERFLLTEQVAALRGALDWINCFAEAHHANQPEHILLHGLTVDIPDVAQRALAATAPAAAPTEGGTT